MISLEEAKLFVRVTHDVEDTILEGSIAAAIATTEDYLGYALEEPWPAPVKAAILLKVCDLFDYREAQSEAQLFRNPTFLQLLNPYRKMNA